MLCEICHKKKATVHYTEIVQNKIMKINLCESCAQKKGVGENINFSMTDLIGGLSQSTDNAQEDQLECEFCGLTFSQFKEIGRFGCDGCYESFEVVLKSMLETIHRNVKHVGKNPMDLSQERSIEIQLEDLQLMLQESIDNEEFEEACRIRDQIKAVKKTAEKIKVSKGS